MTLFSLLHLYSTIKKAACLLDRGKGIWCRLTSDSYLKIFASFVDYIHLLSKSPVLAAGVAKRIGFHGDVKAF